MTKAISTIAFSVALVLPLAVGTALAVWALSASPLGSAADTTASVGQVVAAERTDSTPTTVSFVPGDAFAVTAQSAGTITELGITLGRDIAQGSTAMEVNGLPVVAYVSHSPMYRDIERGMSGDDVATAQQLLYDLGYLDSDPDGKAGFVTSAAIKAFNRALGYGDDNPVLSMGSLLWVPAGSGAPGAITVRVGIDLTPGTELYTTTAGEDRIVVDEHREAASVLTVNDVTVSLEPGQTTITEPETVSMIAAYIGDQSSVFATIALAEPREVGTVSAAALITDASGKVCFFSDVTGQGTVVEAADGSFGLVDVDVELVGTPVLLNPRDVHEDLACG